MVRTHAKKHQPRVLVSAASGHGSTCEIARVIGQTLFNDNIAVDMIPPAAVDSIEDYDAVILGSAVYEGHWMAPAKGFAIRFNDQLATRPVWLFSSGPVGAPSPKIGRAVEQEPADVSVAQHAALLLFRGRPETSVTGRS